MTAYIHGFGMHVPERVVTNDEMAARVGRTAEWIGRRLRDRHERRWADAATSVGADSATAAAHDCLTACGRRTTSELGLLIVASGSARPGFPGPAAEVAARLGLETTPALDVPMASAGSLFGMAMAAQMTGHFGDVLVVGAEKMSAVIEAGPLDPNTAILFGDGAGAALVSERPGRWQILDAVLHSDGNHRDSLAFDWSAPLRMNGLSVILARPARKLPGVNRRSADAAESGGCETLRIPDASGKPESADACRQITGDSRGAQVYSNVARYGQHRIVSFDAHCGGRMVADESARGRRSVFRFRSGIPLGRTAGARRLIFSCLGAAFGSAGLRHQVGSAKQ